MREQYIEGKTTLNEVFAILEACEAANLKHLQRIEQLEELCRDMYQDIDKAYHDHMNWYSDPADYTDRMEQLGLLNTKSVHSTNELMVDTFFKEIQSKTPVEKLENLTAACRKQVD